MRARTWLAIGLAAVVVVAAGVYQALPSDPAKGQARPMRVRLGEPVSAFMAANGIAEGPGGSGSYSVAVDKMRDMSSIFFVDVWVAVHYEEGAFSIDLPPGRILVVGQMAGVVEDFDTTLYERPLPFPEADRRARALREQLLKAGWQAKSVFDPKDESDSNATSNAKYYATLTSAAGNELTIHMMDLSKAPRFDPNIPGSAPVTPADPTPRFLIRVSVTLADAQRDRLSELQSARRFALRGEKREPDLRLWMQDPGWTPEAAGMTEVDVPNPNYAPDKPASGRPVFRRWRMPDGTVEPAIRW